jgi:hypothetical protein
VLVDDHTLEDPGAHLPRRWRTRREVTSACQAPSVVAAVTPSIADDTWFYPGHGKDSTLGAERPHPAEWRTRSW